jgi:hypothetical protein
LPYDQFVIEQLAGDQLPGATQDQIVATGFLRNSMLNEEGGIDPEQFRMEAMFDRIDALGKSVLGLTIQCSQCHDHKFDPLSQEEYYRLFAFLNNDHEAQPTVYRPEELATCDRLMTEMRRIEAGLQEATPDWSARMAAWEAQVASGQPAWEVLTPETYVDSGGGAKLRLLPDQSMLCGGYAPTHCTFRVEGTTRLSSVTAIRLELLTDPNLPRSGPGRSFKGTSALTHIKVEARPAAGGDLAEFKIVEATADFEEQETRSLGQETRRRPRGVRYRRQERNGLGHRRRSGPPQPAAKGSVPLRKADRIRRGRRAGRVAGTESWRLE